MLVIIIIFLLLSLILTYLIDKRTKRTKKIEIDNKNIILNILIYLAVVYFLSQFYSFNPLEIDPVDGIKINPYVSIISIILQYLNILLLNDTWVKLIKERNNTKYSKYILTIIYNFIITIGAYLLYVGYTGNEIEKIYSNIPFFTTFSIITIYIPYLIYNINLLKIINKKKSDKS